jgi:PI31 proteasome regulator N-terminal
MVINPLSGAALATTMAASVSKDGKVQNSYEATALFCHACMLNVGFKLIGLDEDSRIGNI